MARVARAVIRQREFELMALIVRRSEIDPDKGASLSRASMEEYLGLTHMQLRRLMLQLRDRGYIEIKSRFHEDGGQLENAYELTEEGRDYFVHLSAELAEELKL